VVKKWDPGPNAGFPRPVKAELERNPGLPSDPLNPCLACLHHPQLIKSPAKEKAETGEYLNVGGAFGMKRSVLATFRPCLFTLPAMAI
jgi:hypothetical protein